MTVLKIVCLRTWHETIEDIVDSYTAQGLYDVSDHISCFSKQPIFAIDENMKIVKLGSDKHIDIRSFSIMSSDEQLIIFDINSLLFNLVLTAGHAGVTYLKVHQIERFTSGLIHYRMSMYHVMARHETCSPDVVWIGYQTLKPDNFDSIKCDYERLYFNAQFIRILEQ